MSDPNQPDNDTDEQTDSQTDPEPQAVSSEYKVLGHNKSSSGTTYGVLGQVDSSSGYGLYTPDRAKADGGIIAERSNVNAPKNDGTIRTNSSIHMDYDGSDTFKRLYFSDTTGEIYYNPNFNGNAILGVGNVAQFYLSNNATLFATGPVETEGHVDSQDGYRGPVGSAVAPSSSQTIPGDGTLTKISWGNVTADERGEWNASNNSFDCGYDGNYHVDVGVDWSDGFSGTTNFKYDLYVNESDRKIGLDKTDSGQVYQTMSKTLFGLSSGDQLTVEISQNSGSSKDLALGAQHMYFTIYQVGGGGSFSTASTTRAGTTTEES